MNDVENQVIEKQSSRRERSNRHPDRIKIGPEALSRLNQFSEQASECLRGVRLTRSDLVNFLILNRAENLSTEELKSLEEKYFDEVKFAQWAVEELKAAKIRGESISLATILSNNRTTIGKEAKIRSNRKIKSKIGAPLSTETIAGDQS